MLASDRDRMYGYLGHELQAAKVFRYVDTAHVYRRMSILVRVTAGAPGSAQLFPMSRIDIAEIRANGTAYVGLFLPYRLHRVEAVDGARNTSQLLSCHLEKAAFC